ncbi:hypothetical protein WICPIJ_007196 [Wickerhamomyces pijperi]|uniref:Uncharacterized protein n=1 Tax=Wickerhamomyces pijperi TaxID=599730 RepID=A0A9P8Q0A7_WICPI|nr:hypothetical protein WICPIJ_007196 [Wickerhamomyces pijperi]
MLKKEYRSTERYIKAPELFPQQLQQYETQHLKILDLDEFIQAITHQVEIIDFANPELRLNKKQTVSTFETDSLIECEEEFDSDQQYDDFDQIEYYNYYLHDEYMDHYDADKEDATDDTTDLGTEDDEQTAGSRGFLTDLAEYKQRYHVCSTDTEQTTQASLQSVTSSEDDFLQNRQTEQLQNSCSGLRRSRNFYHIPSEQARLLHEYSMAHVDEVDQMGLFTVDHVHDINELHRFASAGGSLLDFGGEVNKFKEEEAGSNPLDQSLKQN